MASAAPPPPPRPTTRTQLDELAATLEASVKGIAAMQPLAPEALPPGSGAMHCAAASQGAAGPVETQLPRALLRKKLERLEACLALWPEADEDPERAELAAHSPTSSAS